MNPFFLFIVRFLPKVGLITSVNLFTGAPRDPVTEHQLVSKPCNAPQPKNIARWLTVPY
jgi:hypothetical protein